MAEKPDFIYRERREFGWFWPDDADSEPNPSHYRKLDEPPAITKEPTP